MQTVTGHFRGVRGLKIFHQAWLPKGEVRAVLLLVHGIGEHSGRHLNVVQHFVPRGYAIYALDHIGHGRSEGPRECVERFTDYTANLATFSGMVHSWQPDKPLFLLAHSLGGLIAAAHLLEHQSTYRGAVFSAPALKPGDSISPVAIAISKLLSVFAPHVGVSELKSHHLSRDPAVVQSYDADPLVHHGRTKARLAAEVIKTMQRFEAAVGHLKLPFIVLQGDADQLVNPAGAQMLHAKASSADKSIKIYRGLYHELFNEPERNRVLADVEAWLAARL